MQRCIGGDDSDGARLSSASSPPHNERLPLDMSVQLTPHFGNVQAHYDLSDDFFRLFLDPTQTYSCAYFERDDMTLEEAQLAKIDLALGKLSLQPGMTLLDIGCGWGATMRRADREVRRQRRGPDVVGEPGRPRAEDVRRDGHPAHAGGCCWRAGRSSTSPSTASSRSAPSSTSAAERYADFFKMAYQVLPADGVMLLHTIVAPHLQRGQGAGHAADARDRPLHPIHPDRDLPGRLAADISDRRRARDHGRFRADPDPVAAAALRQDPGHVGRRARGASATGHRDPVRKRSTTGT